MKILFSNPPWWEQNEDGTLRTGIRAGSRWPFTRQAVHPPDNFRFGGYLPFPFFLGHAASYTQMLLPGANVWMRDSITRGESYAAFAKHLRDARPDWLVIETATPSWTHDSRWLKALAVEMPECRVIIAGTLDCARAPAVLAELPNVAAIVQGEYDKQIAAVVHEGKRGLIPHNLLTRDELNAAPAPMFDEVAALNYWDACPRGQLAPQLQAWTSRGCPHKCLSGDTPVNTVKGMIPIRELVGKSIGVFTYDTIEQRAKIVTVSDIRKTGERQKLVRVRFDDGSHVDCTRDHKFLAFKWGNQHAPEREWLVEASWLRAGQRIRSIKFYDTNGYITATWNRRRRDLVHRMVAAWKVGRELKPSEHVHHIDRDKSNWKPDNLVVMADAKEHFADHPEISQRMRENNPTRNGMSAEWRANLSKSNSGKVRSPEARERYRQAAIKRESARTPEQKRIAAQRMVAGAAKSKPWIGRARANGGKFNHKVELVEDLPGEHDTFCMEVPETHLFFANNMVLRNCVFCVWPAVMTGNDPDGTHARSVRCQDPAVFGRHLRGRLEIAEKRGVPYRSIYLDDDTFNLSQKHTLAMCEVMKEIGLPWSAMCRADTIDRATWQAMKDAGCFGVKLGFESGSQWVLDNIVNKKLNLAEAAETARFLRSIGMTVHGTFTIGLPGETHEQQEETKEFIRMLYETGGLDTHQLSGTAEIEGTPLHTLRTSGHLDKYAGAKIDDGYIVSPDGQRKIESMTKPLLT